jgi:hypothetical protein
MFDEYNPDDGPDVIIHDGEEDDIATLLLAKSTAMFIAQLSASNERSYSKLVENVRRKKHTGAVAYFLPSMKNAAKVQEAIDKMQPPPPLTRCSTVAFRVARDQKRRETVTWSAPTSSTGAPGRARRLPGGAARHPTRASACRHRLPLQRLVCARAVVRVRPVRRAHTGLLL